jgi:lipoprotein-releasing system permease protein
VLLICLMAMGLSFPRDALPAYRAAGTDPVQVLRYE